ncbi:MAG: hypothetical protein JXB14_02585, partial [Candidatus Altiarchaeota archaeon]|nr:hypothetical protein [Candidatus Altiarchaeota archaeon]
KKKRLNLLGMDKQIAIGVIGTFAVLVGMYWFIFHHEQVIDCGIIVNTKIAKDVGRVGELMEVIKRYSPRDHEMICDYVDTIDLTDSSMSLYKKDIEKPRNPIYMARDHMYWTYQQLDKETEDIIAAGILVHESCHAMMYSVMGGFSGMTTPELERPCEGMRYYCMYLAGRYGSYEEMVLDFAGESYGKTKKWGDYNFANAVSNFQAFGGDSALLFCARADLKPEKVPKSGGFQIKITNNGTKMLHCGLINIDDGRLVYPMGCAGLEPGDSYIFKEYIFSDPVTISIWGCGEESGARMGPDS